MNITIQGYFSTGMLLVGVGVRNDKGGRSAREGWGERIGRGDVVTLVRLLKGVCKG